MTPKWTILAIMGQGPHDRGQSVDTQTPKGSEFPDLAIIGHVPHIELLRTQIPGSGTLNTFPRACNRGFIKPNRL